MTGPSPDRFHLWRDCLKTKLASHAPALATRYHWLLLYYHECVLTFLYGDDESLTNQSVLASRLHTIHNCYVDAYAATLDRIDPERFDLIATAPTPLSELAPSEAVCRTLRRVLEDIQILHDTHLPEGDPRRHDHGSFLSAALRRCYSLQDHYTIQAYLFATTESLIVIPTVRTLVRRLQTDIIDPCTKLHFGRSTLLE